MDTSMSTQVIGEIIGTMVLVLLGDGVVAGVSLRKTKAEGAGWIAITLGWGAAVTIGAYAAGYMSFAHLNPAVTIGMAIAGKIGWDMVVPYILGQMIGAIIGAGFSIHSLLSALEGNEGSSHNFRGIRNGTCDSQLRCQLDQ